MKIRLSFSQTIGLLAGSLFALLLSVGACEARTPGGKDDEALETLRKFSEELNRSCPVAFGAATTLAGTLVMPPRTLRFALTVPDSTDVESLQATIVPLLQSMVKDTPGIKPLHDAGTIFSFWFETTENKHLFDFEVTPEEYRTKSKKRR